MEKELIKKRFEFLAPLLNERQLRLYVAAEALVLGRGGITGARVRLWKIGLQMLANETGLVVSVCHFLLTPASGTRSSIDFFLH